MEFELTESVCVAFSLTKEEISMNVTLPYFNPKCSTTLQTDASKKGLGAVLLQNSRPVMFALKGAITLKPPVIFSHHSSVMSTG